MDLSIIIVNYNSTVYLKDCLDSILEFTKDIIYEIIVVDNNSSDRRIEEFVNLYPKVKFVLKSTNHGFGAACNEGFKISTGKFTCLVNPDIKIYNNIFLKFFNYLNNRQDVICCSCLQFDNNGVLTNSFDYFPTFHSELKLIFNIGVTRHLRKLKNRTEIKEGKEFEVDYHIGAFLFLRSEGYKMIEGFDERFFLYSEDIDFGLRLKKLGKKVVCLPSERVFHYYNSTVQGLNGRIIRTIHINRSKMIYYYKHFNFLQRNILRLFMITSVFLRLLYLPFNRVHSENRIEGVKRLLVGMKEFFRISVNHVRS